MNSPYKNRLPVREMSPSRAEYTARINRVLDYIDAHLSESLTLERLAAVAHFSPYHFHRLFAALVGERLFGYIQRIRLERAASWLVGHPYRPVTEIALDSGFGSSAAFARAFKETFACTASEWRRRKLGNVDSNMDQTEGNTGIELTVDNFYFDGESNIHQRRNIMKVKAIEFGVRSIEAMEVVYVRHIGPYAGDGDLFKGLFGRLARWAGPRGLMGPDARWLTIYHDDPHITDENSLRISVCLTVAPETRAEGEIGRMTIRGGQYAVGRFEIATDKFAGAWQAMCADYLPESGWQPSDQPPFEICLNDPEKHPEHKHLIEICVPVKPL
ncbi:AraC family transcriptional regulator [bacterium]|nr:AraC family transcriptional regulator [bacterium]